MQYLKPSITSAIKLHSCACWPIETSSGGSGRFLRAHYAWLQTMRAANRSGPDAFGCTLQAAGFTVSLRRVSAAPSHGTLRWSRESELWDSFLQVDVNLAFCKWGGRKAASPWPADNRNPLGLTGLNPDPAHLRQVRELKCGWVSSCRCCAFWGSLFKLGRMMPYQ